MPDPKKKPKHYVLTDTPGMSEAQRVKQQKEIDSVYKVRMDEWHKFNMKNDTISKFKK